MAREQKTIQVTGLKELEKQLLLLKPSYGLNQLRSTMRLAAKSTLIRAAKATAPRSSSKDNDDDFHLYKNIVVQAERKRQKKQTVQMRFGVRRKALIKDGITSKGREVKRIVGGLSGNKNSPIYDIIVHRENAFLMRAFDQQHGRFLVTFRKVLAKKMIAALKKSDKLR